ncbi:MAG: helix-turn-helix transcriptional regulator [Acidimicrobiales bacterium]
MSAMPAGNRLERLLSIVPWVVANDGPTLAEISDRFDYPEENLLSDLTDVLFMVGTYPFTPDQLVEVVVEDDRVWIHYAEYFERPLRLTPDQALALVTAGSSLLAVPGADMNGPLARGLDKLADTLGVSPGTDIDVDLGSAPAETLEAIRGAIADHRQIEVEYYGYNRDELTRRTLDPYRVTSDEGQWYLLAYCHLAEGERLFRVDRISELEVTGASYEPPSDVPEVSVFEPNPDDPRVTLTLAPAAAWVPQAYPCEGVELLPDGGVRVTLAISAVPWLARLLVRLGPDATLDSVEGDISADLAQQTARLILQRYTGT